MKKLIALILIAIMVLSLSPVAFAEEVLLKWEDRKTNNKAIKTEWPFRPADGYINQQNPPDFSWPRIPGATYDIIICSDKELTDIKYEKSGLTNNFYNFPHPFESGTYYWAVRFKSSEGTSEWTDASRFLILPTAGVYTVATLEGIIDKIPKDHPRGVVTRSELPEYRKLKETNAVAKRYYESLVNTVKGFMENPIPEEPVYDPANSAGLRGTTQAIQNRISKAGELYVINEDPEVGRWGIDVMLQVCEWDIYGATAYEHQDQAFREIMLGLAAGYDSLYYLMTPAERKTVAENLEIRMKILEHPTKGLTDAPYKIPDMPYASHGWTATGFLIQAAIATLGDIPFAETILEKYVPIFTSIAPAWGREDGGYCQGTGYGSGSVLVNEAVVYALNKYGIATLSNKAYFRNEYKFPLYFTGASAGAPFGDGSKGDFNSDWATTNMFLYHVLQNGYAKWQKDKYAYGTLGALQNYYLQTIPEAEAKVPVDLPKSVALPDVGHVAFHSDLTDPYGRVSLYFKSSPFGAYNHSHADQNSFTIVAYNEELAADSGYYDSYASDFYNNYYQRTHAHNSITFDNGEGEQAGATMLANGSITDFITHPDFDLATGSAPQAYNYEYAPSNGVYGTVDMKYLERFDRSIIYIRPDQFIIIDDLKKGNGEKSPFEFWLNSKKDLSMYNTKDGARITQGKAVLETKIQYPEVDGFYSDIFSTTDLVGHTPSGTHAKSPVHKRVWFQTEPTEETKIVATMSTHKTDEPAQYVYTKKNEDSLEMTFEDGTRAYVNLTSDEVSMGGYKTDATAIVVKKETIMAVNATKIEKDGEILLESETPLSYIYGKGELSISAEADSNVKIKTDEIKSIKNEKGDEIAPDKMEFGYNWNYSEGYFNAEVYKGFFTMYLNDKPLPGSPTENKPLKYVIDSKEYITEASGYYDHDNKKILTAPIEVNTDFYVLDKVSDVDIRSNSKAGELLLLRSGESVNITGENPVLHLRSFASGGNLIANQYSNDEMKEKCTVFMEAENYSVKDTEGRIYNTRAFMSGGAGITEFNIFGDSMTWKVEIPEDGEYYLVFCYVGWSGEEGYLQRMFNVDGTIGSISIPETGNYGQVESEWIAAKADTGIQLKKGMSEITIYPKVGNWNLDWIGLVKK